MKTNFIQAFRNQLRKEFDKKQTSFAEFGSVEMAISQIPNITEKRGSDIVSWGDDNLYPQEIRKLKYGSGIHNAIVSSAGDLISGDGFLINGAKTLEESLSAYNSLSVESKTLYDQFINNPYGDQTLEDIHKEISVDCKEIGGFALEVVLNNEFDKVSTIKYLDIANVRAGKMCDGKVSTYYYDRDWSKNQGKKRRELPVFDPKNINKDNCNQIIYVKRGKLEYYPEPDYIGCLTWIQIDYQMGVFHLANIENGMNPSLWWRFYKIPPGENGKQAVLDDLRKNYKGPTKTSKHIVTFSEGKELAPDIAPIAVNNLDKQMIVLAELCDQKILTGNRLTSPLLAGISMPGKMGGDTEVEMTYKIYDKSRMKPYRNIIAATYNKILDFNKTEVKIDINPFNPFV